MCCCERHQSHGFRPRRHQLTQKSDLDRLTQNQSSAQKSEFHINLILAIEKTQIVKINCDDG